MQAPKSVDPNTLLNEEMAAAKNKKKPGLYTVLTIFHEKLGKVILTSKDIIEIAETLMSTFLNDCQRAPDKLGGSGTLADPFLLRSPDDWLRAVATFSNGHGSCYYRVGNSDIEVNRVDTYASDHGKNEALLDEMNVIGLQLLANILQSNDKTNLKDFFDDINNKDEAINKVVPMLFFLAKQLEVKAGNPTRFDPKRNNEVKDLKRVPYSEIAERHEGAVDPTDDMNRLAIAKLPPANDLITQIAQELKRDLSDPDNFLRQLSQQPGGLFGVVEKLARGFVTMVPPQQAQELNQGLDGYFLPFLKQLLPTTEQLAPDNIERYLREKWGVMQGLGKEVPELGELLTQDFTTLLQFLLNTLGNLSVMPSNMAKIVAFTNTILLQEVRQLLDNKAFRPNNYLPVTLVTWLLAESVRYSASYLGSLIMFDLIEAQEITPYAGEPYSFHNALRNPATRHSFTDGYGVCHGGNCKPNNLCDQCDSFKNEREAFTAKLRGFNRSDLKALVRKVRGIKEGGVLPSQDPNVLVNILVKLVYESDSVAEVVGGHHPMTHGNSYAEQKKRSPNKYVMSQQKLANVLMQWLCLQLRGSGLKVTLDKIYLDIPVLSPVSPRVIIDNLIVPLLTLRVKNFKLMSCDVPAVSAIVDVFCAKYGVVACKNKVSTLSSNNFYQELKRATELCEVDPKHLAVGESLKESQHISQKQLTEQALLFGFTCKNVPGDGRCFFHAVADQLKSRRATEFTAKQLIEIATQHILINFDQHYREFMQNGETDQDFLKRVSMPGEWADHIIILALSRAMNINIVIIRSDGENPTIFRRALPQTTVYLGYELVPDGKGGKQGWHYQSLYQNQNPAQAPVRNIYTYFAADIDHENFYHLPIEMPAPPKPMSPFTQSLAGNAPNPTLFEKANTKSDHNSLTSKNGSILPTQSEIRKNYAEFKEKKKRKAELHSSLQEEELGDISDDSLESHSDSDVDDVTKASNLPTNQRHL